MEGLANYGSDDDYDESPQSAQETDTNSKARSADDNGQDNYEDVGMDLSENEESRGAKSSWSSSSTSSPSHTPPSQTRLVTASRPADDEADVGAKARSAGDKHKPKGKSKSRSASRSKSRSDTPERRGARRHRDRGGRRRSRSRNRSRSKSSSSKSRSRSRSPTSRSGGNSRRRDERDRHRDKHRSRDARDSRGRNSYRRRSRSRDRRHQDGRDNYRDSRDSRDSRDARDARDVRDTRDYTQSTRLSSKRFDRACNKLAHLEKMGIDVNKSQDKKLDVAGAAGAFYPAAPNPTPSAPASAGGSGEDRLLPPGVTGRLREQMERRKALWQKKPEADVQEVHQQASNTSGKVWQATTFAHDQEGKQANKFKRLMGIRESPASANDKSTDSLAKKQEELFTSMEQQYEVARTATHTMRGVGLGFGSYQR